MIKNQEVGQAELENQKTTADRTAQANEKAAKEKIAKEAEDAILRVTNPGQSLFDVSSNSTRSKKF